MAHLVGCLSRLYVVLHKDRFGSHAFNSSTKEVEAGAAYVHLHIVVEPVLNMTMH